MRKHFLLFALGLMMMALGVQQIQADGSFPENTIWSEDFESGVLPEGWIATSENWSIDGGDHRDQTTAFSGIKNLLYYYYGSGGVDTLYTATIDLSGYTNVSLNFKFMNAQWEGDIDFLEVFYRNSPDESWTSLGGLIEAEHSDWTGFNISLANVSSTFQLAFAAHSNYGYGVAIDDIYITGTALIPDPAAEVEGSTVEISWNGEGDSFDLRYKPFSVNTGFEDGVLAPWTTIDADGDGYNWFMRTSDIEFAHTGGEYAQSESYANDIADPLTPDNYLVSPKVQLGGSITFWAAAQSDYDYIEHFGVAVSTTSNTDPETFTTIQEWSTTDSRTYYQYSVDLSEYAGQSGYVAIRHFGCTDQFRLNIDDIEIEQPGVTIPESTDWTEVESIFSSPYTIENLEPGSYVLQVRAVEAGVPSNWSESVTFFIEASTGIEEIVDGRSSLVDGQKILHEGHLYLLRDGKIFNAQGARVK